MENKKLNEYDVESSLYSMLRCAQAKQDKEHMELCRAEVAKRKKDLSSLMKYMSIEKSQVLKAQVANRLFKSFEAKEITQEEAELIAIDVMLKAAEMNKNEVPAEQVAAAAGTEVIADPTAVKEIKFAGNLFRDYQVGSVMEHNSNGSTVLQNARKNTQDYVSNSNKINNKQYSDEDLKAEIEASKKK